MGRDREVSCQDEANWPSFAKEMRIRARPKELLHPATAQVSQKVQATSSHVHFFPIHQQIVPPSNRTTPKLMSVNSASPTQQGHSAVSQEHCSTPSVLRLTVMVVAILTTLRTALNYTISHQF